MLTHREAALKSCSYSLVLLRFRAVDFRHDVTDLQPQLLMEGIEKGSKVCYYITDTGGLNGI